MKELFVTKGLIERKEISTRSGRIVLFGLTKKGSNLLEEFGYRSNGRIRQYGLLHEFWRDKVKRYYERLGYKVSCEEKLNGERADLVAEKNDERIAIEIETSNSNAIANIKKYLQSDFDSIISVSVNRQIEEYIKEELKRQKQDTSQKMSSERPLKGV